MKTNRTFHIAKTILGIALILATTSCEKEDQEDSKNYFITEFHDLNSNSVPSGWELYVDNTVNCHLIHTPASTVTALPWNIAGPKRSR